MNWFWSGPSRSDLDLPDYLARITIYSLADASCKELVSVNFKVWNPEARSTNFKAVIENDMWISVNKVIWNSDGLMFGVAFAKHLVQLYSIVELYSLNGELAVAIYRLLEIEVHDGSVNDIAFYLDDEQQLVITCGNDKAVKVITSISIDGEIKARFYNHMVKGVDYDTIGCGYTKFAYSTDDQRFFSCGFIKEGEPFLVEWDDST
ncbi:hypothetical protein K1719_022480 [Acacia pycnantha]|nr:hypothetical protein K1719_022480 [Acacia pycnantha]